MSGKSYLIGIAGPSGAGKSYLAHHLSERLQAPVLALWIITIVTSRIFHWKSAPAPTSTIPQPWNTSC